VGVVFYRRSKPSGKEPAITRAERATTEKPTSTAASQQAKPAEQVISPRITPESVKEFTDAYEEKKQLSIELKSLDSRAQKGKIPRRQYKVQRRAIEIRLETLTRNTSKLKEAFRSSTGAYSDLARQLDSAEEELAEVEENIRTLELRQNRGEISIETYKKNIADYQKRRDKAESTLNGILLRLREKTR
jgi:chromosome segregation ATPase